ncbi:hypothetical protein A4G27_11055 [Mycobacterium kansasii]|nr:hypothetical protein A4G27_11055 [Mycobacterium kansasii]
METSFELTVSIRRSSAVCSTFPLRQLRVRRAIEPVSALTAQIDPADYLLALGADSAAVGEMVVGVVIRPALREP